MPEIRIEIRNKTPTIISETRCIVADNTDYTIHFSFDEDWLSTSKTVFFVLDDGYAFAPAETVNNFVNVPKILTKRMRHMFVGVQQGNVKTTLPCSIGVHPSIASMIDDSAVQPDESMWESVLKRLERLEKHGGGGSGGGIYIGPEETMPEGTKVRIDPAGRKVEIPQIDATLSKPGFAADAKAVGDALGKLPTNEYIVSVFEELKALIEAGNTDGAIAVLDEAILDLAVLA